MATHNDKCRFLAKRFADNLKADEVAACYEEGPCAVAALCFHSAARELERSSELFAADLDPAMPASLRDAGLLAMLRDAFVDELNARWGWPEAPECPAYPPGVAFYARSTWDPVPDIPVAQRLPNAARFLCRLEWSYDMYHEWVHIYALSSNSGQRHWVLWVGVDTLNGDGMEWAPRAWCARKGVSEMSADSAAYFLFRRICEYQRDVEHATTPTELWDTGMLTCDQVSEVLEHVWPPKA